MEYFQILFHCFDLLHTSSYLQLHQVTTILKSTDRAKKMFEINGACRKLAICKWEQKSSKPLVTLGGEGCVLLSQWRVLRLGLEGRDFQG